MKEKKAKKILREVVKSYIGEPATEKTAANILRDAVYELVEKGIYTVDPSMHTSNRPFLGRYHAEITDDLIAIEINGSDKYQISLFC